MTNTELTWESPTKVDAAHAKILRDGPFPIVVLACDCDLLAAADVRSLAAWLITVADSAEAAHDHQPSGKEG